MKRASLLIPAAIIVVANAFALLPAMRNRAGAPDAEMTLTQRELRYFNRSKADDDTGVTLNLEWTDPTNLRWPLEAEKPGGWLDRSKLQQLGFTCSVDANSPGAERYYQRQRPRKAFVALEYDGAAWRAWAEMHERAVAEQRARGRVMNWIDNSPPPSHLVAMDADPDPVKLRGRYPGRTAVVILPAVVAVALEPFPYPGRKLDSKSPTRVVGRIQQLPSSIHVPRPFSDKFLAAGKKAGIKDLSYRVRLRYGTSLEPWIIDVEFTN